MSLVLDPSVVAGWYIGDESSQFTQAVRAAVAAEGAIVPGVWPYEIANMFVMAERRGRMSADDVALALETLAAMPIEVREGMPISAAPGLARLAREYRLSTYDASYLDTAIRTGSSLATLDRDVARAAEHAGIRRFSA